MTGLGKGRIGIEAADAQVQQEFPGAVFLRMHHTRKFMVRWYVVRGATAEEVAGERDFYLHSQDARLVEPDGAVRIISMFGDGWRKKAPDLERVLGLNLKVVDAYVIQLHRPRAGMLADTFYLPAPVEATVAADLFRQTVGSQIERWFIGEHWGSSLGRGISGQVEGFIYEPSEELFETIRQLLPKEALRQGAAAKSIRDAIQEALHALGGRAGLVTGESTWSNKEGAESLEFMVGWAPRVIDALKTVAPHASYAVWPGVLTVEAAHIPDLNVLAGLKVEHARTLLVSGNYQRCYKFEVVPVAAGEEGFAGKTKDVQNYLDIQLETPGRTLTGERLYLVGSSSRRAIEQFPDPGELREFGRGLALGIEKTEHRAVAVATTWQLHREEVSVQRIRRRADRTWVVEDIETAWYGLNAEQNAAAERLLAHSAQR